MFCESDIYTTCTTRDIVIPQTQHIYTVMTDYSDFQCPAVAVAVAKAKLQRRDIDKREFSFPVFEVADSLGTDPVIVKSELSRLKWLITPTGESSTQRAHGIKRQHARGVVHNL